MTFSIQSALSALKAFGDKMGVAANNIANVETEGFKKSRATLVENSEKSVTVNITRSDTPGSVTVDTTGGQLTEKEQSNVDLAEEIPQTVVAQRGYEANLSTIRTQDEMMKSVIDIIK
jgi:flagellar hook protein FlgE